MTRYVGPIFASVAGLVAVITGLLPHRSGCTAPGRRVGVVSGCLDQGTRAVSCCGCRKLRWRSPPGHRETGGWIYN